ncbi:MAG: ABC transporter permease [Acidobacteriota bacterium]|nr:ABC transporter permease [Acidobacteriota bacterium]
MTIPRILRNLAAAIGLVLSILVVWQLIIWVFAPEEWLFPSPRAVWLRFWELVEVDALQHHVKVTAIEVLAGYALGLVLGVLTGYPISQLRIVEKIATPYLVAANSVPLVAFAPLLLLWFGNGIGTKIIVAGLIVYFPMTMSTIAGFHGVSPMHARLLHSMRANKWQRFRYLELPSAVPGLLAGMKIGAPLAVVGAVVGEFLGTGEGLGHLILEANGLLDTAQLFVAIIILAFFGIGFYLMTLSLELMIIGPWHNKRRM